MKKSNYKRRGLLHKLQRSIYKKNELIEKNSRCRCLVILHLFYEESWPEIDEYLKNLSNYDFKLLVTFTQDKISKRTLDAINNAYQVIDQIQCANKGYDVLPFLLAIKQINLDDYDIVFKIHSKSTKRSYLFIYNQFFLRRTWFVDLFDGILSAKNIDEIIDMLFDDTGYGLAAANNLIIHDPKHKKNMVHSIANQNGISIPDEYQFVAGTCFAAKAVCLKTIQKMDIDDTKFLPVYATRGMSYAHFLERYLCINIAMQNYKFYGTQTSSIKHLVLTPISKLYQHHSSERLFDENIDLDDEWFYWQMDNRQISWKFENIRFSDLYCTLDYKVFKMTEGAPYKYLKGDTKGYESYCRKHEEYGLPLMTKDRFDKLIDSIHRNGYDERKVIVVNENNIILDGQHRACILCDMLGEYAEVRVLKVKVINVRSVIKRHLPKKIIDWYRSTRQ